MSLDERTLSMGPGKQQQHNNTHKNKQLDVVHFSRSSFKFHLLVLYFLKSVLSNIFLALSFSICFFFSIFSSSIRNNIFVYSDHYYTSVFLNSLRWSPIVTHTGIHKKTEEDLKCSHFFKRDIKT